MSRYLDYDLCIWAVALGLIGLLGDVVWTIVIVFVAHTLTTEYANG